VLLEKRPDPFFRRATKVDLDLFAICNLQFAIALAIWLLPIATADWVISRALSAAAIANRQ